MMSLSGACGPIERKTLKWITCKSSPWPFDICVQMETRRQFLRKILTALSFFGFGQLAQTKKLAAKKTTGDATGQLFRAINGSPAENLSRVIELSGGVESFIEADDIIVIKPNVQWWNQGAPNISALVKLVDLIMNRPGSFRGEVVLAENCHRGSRPWESENSGWLPNFERNSNLVKIQNYNDLTRHLKQKYGDGFSICHWINVGNGGGRVFSPADGSGYVYCDGSGSVPLISIDNGHKGDSFRATVMSYPIFQTDRGTLIDFKNGIWARGSYTDQPLRFINYAALNHHSTYCGATSSIKNYLGISDLSGGPDPHNGGRLTDKYYNFHSFPFNKWGAGPEPGMIGAEIAVFMDTIRRADLNITSAEWVGLVSRTETPVARTSAMLACKDPVALDYHATKYILYPNSRISVHNPDNKEGPLFQYLFKCAELGGGEFDETKVAVKSYDFKNKRLQTDDELTVIGEKEWGRNPKMLLKYIFLRTGLFS